MKNIMKERCSAAICTGCQKKLAGIEKKVKIMRIWRWCMVLCTILLLWSGELHAQVSLPKDPAVMITIRKKNNNSTYTLGAFSDIPEDAEVAVQSFNEKIVSIQYVDKYGDSEDVDNGDAYGISDGIKQSGGTWKTGDFVLCAHRQGTTDVTVKVGEEEYVYHVNVELNDPEFDKKLKKRDETVSNTRKKKVYTGLYSFYIKNVDENDIVKVKCVKGNSLEISTTGDKPFSEKDKSVSLKKNKTYVISGKKIKKLIDEDSSLYLCAAALKKGNYKMKVMVQRNGKTFSKSYSFSQKDPYSNPFKKIQFGGKSENYSGLFNYRINVSSGKGLSKSQAKALQGQQTMYIEMKEGYELVKVESFVSAMAGGTGRNALTKSKQGNGYQIRLSATLEDGKTYPGAYSRIIITCKKEGKGYFKREFEIYP